MDIGHKIVDAAINVGSAMLNPFNFNLNFGMGKRDIPGQVFYAPPDGERIAQDGGYALAERLLPPVHHLAELLVTGPDELNGVNWEALAGRRAGTRKDAIWNIQASIEGALREFSKEQSGVAWQVREDMKPTHKVSPYPERSSWFPRPRFLMRIGRGNDT